MNGYCIVDQKRFFHYDYVNGFVKFQEKKSGREREVEYIVVVEENDEFRLFSFDIERKNEDFINNIGRDKFLSIIQKPGTELEIVPNSRVQFNFMDTIWLELN